MGMMEAPEYKKMLANSNMAKNPLHKKGADKNAMIGKKKPKPQGKLKA